MTLHFPEGHSQKGASMLGQTSIASSLIIGVLLFAGVAVGTRKAAPPPPPLCQALSDVYVNPTTSEDLVVSLPPKAVHTAFTVWAREDDRITSQWLQCTPDQICPIGLSGFQYCGVQGNDPRDGAEKFHCVFRNNGTIARRARLVVMYKRVPVCCQP
jgi:hypothetical protein